MTLLAQSEPDLSHQLHVNSIIHTLAMTSSLLYSDVQLFCRLVVQLQSSAEKHHSQDGIRRGFL